MNRDVINIMLSQYSSKTYKGGMFLYFNNANKVIGIKTRFTTVVGFSVDTDPNHIMLLSYFFNSQIGRAIFTVERTFVIPNNSELRLYAKCRDYDEISEAALPALYEVVNYGFLDSEMYKGCNMSTARLQVLAKAASGNIYEANYVTSENVIAGLPIACGKDDNYYAGSIEKAYKLAPLGKMIDGKLEF